MKIRALALLALLCVSFVPRVFALNPNDVANASRILENVTRIANETQVLTPGAELVAPEPRDDTKGKFISPYMKDGSLAGWAKRGINAAAGSMIAGEATDRATDHAVGQLAGRVPGGAIVGGLFKKKAKDKAQEVGAVAAMGGWKFIRESSDISFDSAEELAVYMHATHSGIDAGFAQALSASFGAYPELKDAYEPAVRNAYAAAAARGAVTDVPPAPEVVVPVAVPAEVETVEAQAVQAATEIVTPVVPSGSPGP